MRRSALIALCLLPVAAFAAPQDELQKTQAALKASEAKKERLLQEETALADQLGALQEKLVRAAELLEKSDRELERAERALADTDAQLVREEREAVMAKKRLDGLSRMAIRLSRTPPQAMVLMPADGKERLQAARALALITQEIKSLAEHIAMRMQQLADLREKQAKERDRAGSLKTARTQEKQSFEADIKKRQALRDRLVVSRKKEEAAIAQLAKKAGNLEELVRALQARQEDETAGRPPAGKEVEAESKIAGVRGEMRRFAAAKGRIRVPVSGAVIESFGARNAAGDASKGIRIAARRAATVIAPYDAEVVYSGTFLNYGRLIILKHRGSGGDNYHTLLAGISRVDVKTGDFLLEGEPIGVMGYKDDTRLYVELRENNQPVNPKSWMRGL